MTDIPALIARVRELGSATIDEHSEDFAALEAAMAENERLREALADLADADCEYGDNCPSFGTRHGRCTGCKARLALEGTK